MNNETKVPKLLENKVSISKLKLITLLNAQGIAEKHDSNFRCVFLTSFGMVSGTLLDLTDDETQGTVERAVYDGALKVLSDLESKSETPLEVTDYGGTITLRDVTVIQGRAQHSFSSLTLFVNQIVGYSLGNMTLSTDV